MKDLIKDLLSSKKFIMAVIAVVAQIAAKYGLQIDESAAWALVSPLIAAIIGQGIADHGKSTALINSETISTQTKTDNTPTS